MRAALEREALDRLDLLVGVAREAVDRDDGIQAELLHDPEMALHVRRAALDRVDAAVGVVAVVLERTRGRHEDDRVRAQPADAADDVEELLHAHVGAEAGLGHRVVAELERGARRDEGVVAVRDVGERAAVEERGLALERLDEVRLDRVLEQDGHRARSLELLGRDRLALPGVADGDLPEPLAEVEEVARDGDDGHDLGGSRDVEARLADVAVRAAAEPDDDRCEARGR